METNTHKNELKELELFVDFVIGNRKKEAFVNWDREDLYYSFIEGYHNGTLAVSHDKGKMNGLVLGRKDDEKKIFHVIGIIGTHPKVLGNFIKLFSIHYPDYTLTGNRRGKLKTYKFPEILKKFINISWT